MTLNELNERTVATVVSIDADCPNGRRLMEMGITPGVRLQIVKSAPFGDPIEVSLRGYRLAMRRNEAASIIVS